MTAKPLAGVKVIELGTVIAGPFAGSLLAELGAEVIKIEPPGPGDVLRRMGPIKDGVPTGEYVDFMTGLVTPDGNVWGRPVAVTQTQQGALIVSDDGGDCLFRRAARPA